VQLDESKVQDKLTGLGVPVLAVISGGMQFFLFMDPPTKIFKYNGRVKMLYTSAVLPKVERFQVPQKCSWRASVQQFWKKCSSLGDPANPLSREELASFCLPAKTFCKTRTKCKDFFS